ncbi:MAG: hypothetical protein SCK70_02535 [bacterium]|nr:hypothetical protein [bacterium]
MDAKHQRLIFGVLVIVAGLLLVLNNLKLFAISPSFYWGIMLVIFGLIFFRIHQQLPRRKTTLIFAIAFFIIGVWMILDSLFYLPDDILGALLLWSLGAVFISAFIRDNRRWGWVIPAGVCLVLGAIVVIDAFRLLDNQFLGFIFLLGVGLTFWFLYLIRNEKNKLSWAGIVGAIIVILSFYVLSTEWNSPISDVMFPLSLIFFGAILVIRGVQKK